MEKEKNYFFLRFCVALPFIILCCLVIFVYSIYMSYYVIPLMTETYWYDNSKSIDLNAPRDELFYPLFKGLADIEDKIFSFSQLSGFRFYEKSDPNSNLSFLFKKGNILFFLVHYLLFWIIVSIYKTMTTHPGEVPEQWTSSLEDKLNLYFYKLQSQLITVQNEELKKQREKDKEKEKTSLKLKKKQKKYLEDMGRENINTPLPISPYVDTPATNPKTPFLDNFENGVEDNGKVDNDTESEKDSEQQGRQGDNSDKLKNIEFLDDQENNESIRKSEIAELSIINQKALSMVMEKENARLFLEGFFFNF